MEAQIGELHISIDLHVSRQEVDEWGTRSLTVLGLIGYGHPALSFVARRFMPEIYGSLSRHDGAVCAAVRPPFAAVSGTDDSFVRSSQSLLKTFRTKSKGSLLGRLPSTPPRRILEPKVQTKHSLLTRPKRASCFSGRPLEKDWTRLQP